MGLQGHEPCFVEVSGGMKLGTKFATTKVDEVSRTMNTSDQSVSEAGTSTHEQGPEHGYVRRHELQDLLAYSRREAKVAIVGAVLMLLAGLCLVFSVTLLLSSWMPAWVAALIVAVLLTALSLAVFSTARGSEMAVIKTAHVLEALTDHSAPTAAPESVDVMPTKDVTEAEPELPTRPVAARGPMLREWSLSR